MSSVESDDEEETALLQSVSNYYFEDDQKEPISFSILPIQWTEKETLEESKVDVFLRGTSDGGLLTIHKPVIAWKFDISNVGTVKISVLTKDKLWLALEKPKKSFEHVIRSILVSIYCLHCVRKNPDLSEKSLWDQLRKTFSSYEEKPSSYDLVNHYGMMDEAVKRDPSLAKSKFLQKLLKERPRKRKLLDEEAKSTTMSGFIVEDTEDDVIDETEVDESDEDEDDPFDTVCAFCDNGGELLCCDGKCMRSFHATVEAGEESQCESLGLSPREVSEMQSFLCKNCEYKQYQCFACGKLGAFDHPSAAEVFRCANATCGHFYHPHCVAKLLHAGDGASADDLANRIANGESFACPIHKCYVCNLVEDKKKIQLQFAVCRRCPKSYHRKCLPKEIVFEDEDDEDTLARAWNDLLPHRALIYCLEHEIDDDLRTPVRDHIKFPDTEVKKASLEERGKHKASALPLSKDKALLKKKIIEEGEKSGGRTMIKALKQLPSTLKEGQTTEKREKVMQGQESVRRLKAPSTTKKPLKETAKSMSAKVDGVHKPSLGDQLFELVNKRTESVKPGKQDTPESHPKNKALVKQTSKKFSSEATSLDPDSETSLLAILKEVESSITLEKITKKHKPPSTHSYSLKAVVEKITMGKIEVSTEAVQTAIKKLEQSSSIEDAKAVCGPDILDQILKWQNKLKVYLAPFLHGMRYTSFGRHFTKVEKLEEVVDKLHWYVEDGDMIVDFCCGANDFSVLMSKKLQEEGKKCSYKNYDAMPPQKYFNYEQRDWMRVEPKELPDGSKLVMGLNPPFGVKAALADKFINKALEFKPKLLILIVPQETERLDKKKVGKRYELVWEDQTFLSGKSFYLPGSVDAHDKAMDQWNVLPPPLYLWSRADWAVKHKAIAKEHGHLSTELKHHVQTDPATSVKSATERSTIKDGDKGEQDSQVQAKNQPDKPVGTIGSGDEKPKKAKEGICRSGKSGEAKRKRKHGDEKQDTTAVKCDSKNRNDPPRKKRHSEQMDRSGSDVRSPGHDPSRAMPTAEKHQELPHRSPPSVRSSSSLTEVDGDKGSQHVKHTIRSPHDRNSLGNTTEKNQDLPHSSPSVGTGDKSNRHTAPSTRERLPHYSPSSVRPNASTAEGTADKLGESFERKGWSQHFSQARSGTSYGNRGNSHMNNGPSPHGAQNQSFYGGMESHAPHRPHTTGLEREYSYMESHDPISHMHAGLYGQGPDISAQRGYMAAGLYGHGPGYGQVGPSPSSFHGGSGVLESSFGMNPPARPQYSTMQRYAPRLDELNHSRMGISATRPPMMNDPRPVSQPGYGGPYPMGFAHGPQNPHSSAGWLNE